MERRWLTARSAWFSGRRPDDNYPLRENFISLPQDVTAYGVDSLGSLGSSTNGNNSDRAVKKNYHSMDSVCAPLEVTVAVHIQQIIHVGDPANTFRCAFDLQLEWHDETFRSVLDGDVDFAEVQWSRHFQPRWSLVNCVDVMHVQEVSPAVFSLTTDLKKSKIIVRCTRRVLGTFFEPFALRYFPLDVQGLSIAIACTQPVSRVVLVDARTSSFDAGPFSPKLAEWVFLSPRGTPFTSVQTQRDITAPRSVFVARMPVRRRAGYYLANVVPTYFALVAFGWLGFGDDSQDCANRLTFLAALLLTCITFKFVFKEKLPRVHYLTLLDWYIYLVVALLSLQGAAHVWAKATLDAGMTRAASFQEQLGEVRRIERKILGCLAGFWVLLHATIVLLSRSLQRSRNRWTSGQLRIFLDEQRRKQLKLRKNEESLIDFPQRRPSLTKSPRSVPPPKVEEMEEEEEAHHGRPDDFGDYDDDDDDEEEDEKEEPEAAAPDPT